MMMDLEVRIIQRVDCIEDTNKETGIIILSERRRERGAMRGQEEGMGDWGYLNTLHFQGHGCCRLP